MSVRSSLLAILTIGPAYGFQLHGELASRTAGRRQVNVGQIYGTLTRLLAQELIESAGATPDGLPLYRLTARGRTEALHWLHDTDSAVGDEWNDFVDRVLIASSLPGIDIGAILSCYRDYWESRTGRLAHPDHGSLAAGAASALANAALVWLTEATALIEDGEDCLERGLSADRPRRGRRPSSASGSLPG